MYICCVTVDVHNQATWLLDHKLWWLVVFCCSYAVSMGTILVLLVLKLWQEVSGTALTFKHYSKSWVFHKNLLTDHWGMHEKFHVLQSMGCQGGGSPESSGILILCKYHWGLLIIRTFTVAWYDHHQLIQVYLFPLWAVYPYIFQFCSYASFTVIVIATVKN